MEDMRKCLNQFNVNTLNLSTNGRVVLKLILWNQYSVRLLNGFVWQGKWYRAMNVLIPSKRRISLSAE
jgi:hypothetical protein